MEHLKQELHHQNLFSSQSGTFDTSQYKTLIEFYLIRLKLFKEIVSDWTWNNWFDWSVHIVFPSHSFFFLSLSLYLFCLKLEHSMFQNIRTNSKGSFCRGGGGRNWVSFIDVWSWGMFLPAFFFLPFFFLLPSSLEREGGCISPQS